MPLLQRIHYPPACGAVKANGLSKYELERAIIQHLKKADVLILE
jgi:hypothetical protein